MNWSREQGWKGGGPREDSPGRLHPFKEEDRKYQPETGKAGEHCVKQVEGREYFLNRREESSDPLCRVVVIVQIK